MREVNIQTPLHIDRSEQTEGQHHVQMQSVGQMTTVVWTWSSFFKLLIAISTFHVAFGACWLGLLSIWKNDVPNGFFGLLALSVQLFIPVTIMVSCYIRMILVLNTRLYQCSSRARITGNFRGEGHAAATSLEKSLLPMQDNLLKTRMIVTAGVVYLFKCEELQKREKQLLCVWGKRRVDNENRGWSGTARHNDTTEQPGANTKCEK